MDVFKVTNHIYQLLLYMCCKGMSLQNEVSFTGSEFSLKIKFIHGVLRRIGNISAILKFIHHTECKINVFMNNYLSNSRYTLYV